MTSVKQANHIAKFILLCCIGLFSVSAQTEDMVLTTKPVQLPPVGDSILLDQGVDANLPELGDTSQNVLSAQDEQRIAEQILRQVAQSDEVEQDPEIRDYIVNLGQKLALSGPNPGQDFHFFVVKDPTINAFAMPGGVIGVHTGLILASKSESELASVLGHEIGHVTQHHLARMLENQKKGTLKNAAGLALALLIASSGNAQLTQGALTTVTAYGVQMQLDYTRAHEREADRVGLQILNNAGFDVRGMPAFFTTLQRTHRFTEGAAPGFLRTHPLTLDRIADVGNRVTQMPYKQVVDSLDYQLVRAKLRAKGSFLDRNASQSSVAFFEQNILQKRYANPTVEYYGLAVAQLNLHHFVQAKKAIDWLNQHAEPHAMLANLNAEYYLVKGEGNTAAQKYQESLAQYPSNRALIYGYTQHLLRAKQHALLVDFVSKKLAYWPNDHQLYQWQSRAYALQNQQLLSHQALGEAYYRQYDLGRAVEQMALAAKSPGGDFYQRSIVEARLKVLRTELKKTEAANDT